MLHPIPNIKYRILLTAATCPGNKSTQSIHTMASDFVLLLFDLMMEAFPYSLVSNQYCAAPHNDAMSSALFSFIVTFRTTK